MTRTEQEWRTEVYNQHPNTNSRTADMCAYLMANRFPNARTQDLTKWLLRIESHAHWAHADEQTTNTLLNYVAKYNHTVKQKIQ